MALPGRRRLSALALCLLPGVLLLGGCVEHVIKNDSVGEQLERAAGNGQGWQVSNNSNNNSNNNAGGGSAPAPGYTPHKPGNFIFDPAEPH